MLTELTPIYKDKCQEALDYVKKAGATAAAISFNHNESHGIGFENGRLKGSASKETMGYGITVTINGKNGTATGNQAEDLMTIAQRAVQLAAYGSEAHFTEFPKPLPADAYPVIKKYDPNVFTTLTDDKIISDCQDIVDSMKSIDGTLVVGAGANIIDSETLCMLSSGYTCIERGSMWSINGDVQKTTGTDMLQLYRGRAWGQMNGLYDLQYIKDSITEDLRNSARQATLPAGNYPLLLPPAMVARFLSPVFMGINGYNVFKGISPLQDTLGKKVFDDALTIEDNPHIDFAGSAAVSEAGLPTQRRTLIENGTVNLFLYDYDTACLAGKETTCNNDCSPYHPIVKPGSVTSADIIKGLKKGLFIRRLLGFGQSNLLNGDFSCNVELGFAIENGEITGRIKNAMISGNILEMLKQPLVISSDTDPVNNLPYLLFPAVAFTA